MFKIRCSRLKLQATETPTQEKNFMNFFLHFSVIFTLFSRSFTTPGGMLQPLSTPFAIFLPLGAYLCGSKRCLGEEHALAHAGGPVDRLSRLHLILNTKKCPKFVSAKSFCKGKSAHMPHFFATFPWWEVRKHRRGPGWG